MRRRIVVAALILCAAPSAYAAERSLDRWFDSELLPYVSKQLVEHPRFKGETVMFVVLEGNAPVAVSNALTLSLRDRLLEAALDTAGVSIGRRQGGPAPGNGASRVDCTRDDVHYYIGIELSRRIDGSYRVDVRALDLEDRNWVTGFGLNWQGRLNSVQRQALRRSQADRSFHGARDVPFAADETDLLAAHLAHELSCALLRQTGGSYIVGIDAGSNDVDGLEETVALAGNNLARLEALELSRDEQSINAKLAGKAHRIDGALFQYWLTVTPTDPNGELTTLGTSAYIVLPEIRLADGARDAPAPTTDTMPDSSLRPPPQTPPRASISIPSRARDALLGPLRIGNAYGSGACGGGGDTSVRRTAYNGNRQSCSVLSADARRDAIVFVLQHQANHGLVRLGGAECRKRISAQVITVGRTLRHAIPQVSAGRIESQAVFDWPVSPGVDTYYAVAVSDARAARQFANHLDELPMRCEGGLRPGLADNELYRWLEQFAMLAARHAGHVDWRAIQVKDVL